ncbi:MAG: DUF2207 domain-containing protein [Oscillospiraceae bacterium]|nr:DUF2207 domain-containing protein [Oscillospiraceae bacterium]MBR2889908.1 DUF2207 domain-containing protein [Oscillospiraceae bacterium]
MRRLIALLLCLFLLSATVYADNAVTMAQSTASVNQTGACQITMTVTIRLDTAVRDLVFPIGTDVSGVTVNGKKASLKNDNGITAISLKELGSQTGLFSLTIHYTANQVVTTDPETGKQTVTVPLLYGFRYPVEALQFSVTMPGLFDAEPVFYSGYHEQDIERSLTYTINGATITGSITARLKDSETLFLQLDAPEGMFPRERAAGGSLVFDTWAMIVLGGLALLYWMAFQSRLPILPTYRATAPEGISAGAVGSYLNRFPADLTLMVVHWAQLGYLIIQPDGNGRVLLHKKMEMGNERSGFEQKTFRKLFGKKQLADATGQRYAALRDETARISRRFSAGFRKGAAGMLLFRLLCSGVALFAGVAVGDCVTSSPMWRVFWMVVIGGVFAGGSWMIQEGFRHLRHPGKAKALVSLAIAVGMLVMGLMVPAGLMFAAIAAGTSLLAGLMVFYGGKRTDNGARIYGELLGLRRYMGRVAKSELGRILRSNPNYYYELAPFALAMGMDKKFASRFDNLHLTGCGWLLSGMASPRTAGEWYLLLRETVEAMNALSDLPARDRR